MLRSIQLARIHFLRSKPNQPLPSIPKESSRNKGDNKTEVGSTNRRTKQTIAETAASLRGVKPMNVRRKDKNAGYANVRAIFRSIAPTQKKQ